MMRKKVQEHNRLVEREECIERWGFDPDTFTGYQGTWTIWFAMEVSAMVERTDENIARARELPSFKRWNPDGCNQFAYIHLWFGERSTHE